tara:strand:+ start:856 stop:1494 length:639 start_codon:yes stop_codon:yes gene_type:complete
MKKIKVAILDYGFGNIKSLSNALNYIGYEVSFFTKNKENFDVLVIPGVGSFNNAIKKLKKMKFVNHLKNLIYKRKKIIGICLGMQIILDVGFENKETRGFGLINGKVSKIKFEKKLPIVGYFPVKFFKKKNIDLTKFNMKKFYHIHSFEAKSVSMKNVLSNSIYEKKEYISSILNDNFVGFQFHPEKSGEIGIKLIKNTISQLLKKNEIETK